MKVFSFEMGLLANTKHPFLSHQLFKFLTPIIVCCISCTFLLGPSVPAVYASSEEMAGSGASTTAGKIADKAIVQPIVYENANQQGPAIIVLPGQFKVTTASFKQRFTANNIADFAELELGRANFKVLEREHLGPLLDEVVLAANMGDAEALKKFRKGKFVTTRWFLQFDVLKAEPVAEAETGYDGKALGNLVTALAGDKVGGRIAGSAISSTGASENAKVWLIGIKYKILDASTSEIVKTNYIEDKMEVGGSNTKFFGLSLSEGKGMTIDSMVHRLIQKCVAEVDKVKGSPSSVAIDKTPLGTSPAKEQPTGAGHQKAPTTDTKPGKNSAYTEPLPEKTQLPIRRFFDTPLPAEKAVNTGALDLFSQVGNTLLLQENSLAMKSSDQLKDTNGKKLTSFVLNTTINSKSGEKMPVDKQFHQILRKTATTSFPQFSLLQLTTENINNADYVIIGNVNFVQFNNQVGNLPYLFLYAVDMKTHQVKAHCRIWLSSLEFN